MCRSLRSLLVLALVAGCGDDSAETFEEEFDTGQLIDGRTLDTGPQPDGAWNDEGGAPIPESARPFELAFEPITWDGGRGYVTDFRFVPERDEFVILQKDGLVVHYAFDVETQTAAPLGSFEVVDLEAFSDCGLLVAEFDPDFADNRFLYVGHCVTQKSNAITRYTMSDDYGAIADTARRILLVEDPDAPRPYHNIGSMGFDDDGAMWAIFGDKTVDPNGQDPTNLLGALIRIIPSRDPDEGGYTVPADNPFVGSDEGADEVWAYGLRAPFRSVRDHLGRYWIADVGLDAFEEINVADTAGLNFGWITHEGPCEADCDGFTDPALWYGHGDDEDYLDYRDAVPTDDRSVWAGIVYEDRGNDPYEGRLTDRLLWGDFFVGFVRVAEVDAEGVATVDARVGHLEWPSAWEQHTDGYLYVAAYGDRRSPPPDGPWSSIYRVQIAND